LSIVPQEAFAPASAVNEGSRIVVAKPDGVPS
jgi:hypothetical protein